MKAIKEFETECPRCGNMVLVDWVSLEAECKECGFEFYPELPEELEAAIAMFNKALSKFRKWGYRVENGILRKQDITEIVKKAFGGE